jgi:hypothetical protein
MKQHWFVGERWAAAPQIKEKGETLGFGTTHLEGIDLRAGFSATLTDTVYDGFGG